MASLNKRLPTNSPGDFFVDSTCINCETCQWMVPEVFNETNGRARVHRQPETEELTERSLQALIACPTSSIGTQNSHAMRTPLNSFPRLIEEPVYHCGFHSEKSFGATSYFIKRKKGNILIDSPRFASPLVKKLDALGGVSLMFLTHRDDVADHQQFAKKFGLERLIFEPDAMALPEAEHQLTGLVDTAHEEGMIFIPTPGHTKGSGCLLYENRFLFTGDHLAWDPEAGHVRAFRNACWYDWEEQIVSVAKLLNYHFEWLLPGHGWPIRLEGEQMRQEIGGCVEWMKSVR